MATALRMSVRNGKEVMARLQRFKSGVNDKIRPVMENSMDRLYAMQQSLCPVDTGRMKRSVRKELGFLGLGYRVGWTAGDFPAAFYPVFVEFGTRFSPAQPSLLPAAEAEWPRLIKELGAALRTEG